VVSKGPVAWSKVVGEVARGKGSGICGMGGGGVYSNDREIRGVVTKEERGCAGWIFIPGSRRAGVKRGREPGVLKGTRIRKQLIWK